MLNFNFIVNYRLSVSEALKDHSYAEAVWRLIMFPIVYAAAIGTELLFESSLLARITKAINCLLGKDERNKVYVVDENGILHLGNSIPKYDEIEPEVLDAALERSIHRANQTGKMVRLGDVIEEIKAERR